MRIVFVLLVAMFAFGCHKLEAPVVAQTPTTANDAQSSSGDVPEKFSDPPEIMANLDVERVLITKLGWRSGQAAILLERPDEVQRLYDLLAGNRRVAWTCGYHWNVAFEYSDGRLENIAINEHCEEFERESTAVTQALHKYFAQAKETPPHHIAHVTRKKAFLFQTLEREASGIGDVFGDPRSPYAFIVSNTPWTAERLALLRALPSAASAEVPEERDLGN